MNLRQLAGKVLLVVSCTLALPAPGHAEAELWSDQPNNQHPGTANHNRIIRWCSKEGKADRFASANLSVRGYEPCGELNVPITCDPSGRRLISKSTDVPYTYKDCGIGPRIQLPEGMNAKLDESGNPVREAARADEAVDPLSTKEKFDLKQDLKKAEKEQSQELDVALQRVMDSLMNKMIANAVLSPQRQRSATRSLNAKQIDQLMRYVDPQQQQKFKQLMQNGF